MIITAVVMHWCWNISGSRTGKMLTLPSFLATLLVQVQPGPVPCASLLPRRPSLSLYWTALVPTPLHGKASSAAGAGRKDSISSEDSVESKARLISIPIPSNHSL